MKCMMDMVWSRQVKRHFRRISLGHRFFLCSINYAYHKNQQQEIIFVFVSIYSVLLMEKKKKKKKKERTKKIHSNNPIDKANILLKMEVYVKFKSFQHIKNHKKVNQKCTFHRISVFFFLLLLLRFLCYVTQLFHRNLHEYFVILTITDKFTCKKTYYRL